MGKEILRRKENHSYTINRTIDCHSLKLKDGKNSKIHNNLTIPSTDKWPQACSISSRCGYAQD